ncbi:hypothetical protein T492DRAFT_600680 [Pavlovales sp. CCMP2436]|nr:hypothetical protein T492DRAFT_600680 [Pavlovales sp. CCMP2436]
MVSDTKQLMDANTAYCEKQKVFQLLEGLMSRLIVEQPDDPIAFLIGALQSERKPRVILASVDSEVLAAQAETLSKSSGLVLVDVEHVANTILTSSVGEEAKKYLDRGEQLPDALVVQALTQRLLANDCQTKGWVLTSFPKTIEQAQLLLSMGNLPTLYVHLEVPGEQTLMRLQQRPGYSAEGVRAHVLHNDFMS